MTGHARDELVMLGDPWGVPLQPRRVQPMHHRGLGGAWNLVTPPVSDE